MAADTAAPSLIAPAQLSKLAMSLMQKHQVVPTPEHYAVWYAYAESRNKALMEDIDRVINQNMPFSPSLMDSLYQRHCVQLRGEQQQAAAGDAQRILNEVLKMVHEFGSETQTHSRDIDASVSKVAAVVGDNPEVQGVVKQLLSATASLKSSGEKMTQKLEASEKEIEHLRKNLETVTEESQRDFLTKVYNRKAYDHLLNESLKEAMAKNQELCLLMIDIDHFKQFNDKFGHPLGDEVLKIVAKSLTDCVRGKDIVARYGGEEFSVVLPQTPMIGASKVAESIRSTIAARELKRKDTGESYGALTVSIGVARLRHDHDSAETLVKRADEALYHSKSHGRNRVTQEPSY